MVSKYDPTQTLTLRNLLQKEFNRRLRKLQKEIVELVVEEDAFGLKFDIGNDIVGNVRWRFLSNPAKVNQFISWLSDKLGFFIGSDPLDSYWTRYIRDAFLRGAGRALRQVRPRRLGISVLDLATGGARATDQFTSAFIQLPESRDKLELLASRTFSNLKNISESTANTMRGVLVDGLARGENPRTIARELVKEIDTITKKRAETIARTEIVRAHNEGQLQSMRVMGVQEVGVQVEWETAGDGRVCPLCKPLDGIVLKLDEAEGLLPRHPNCRCVWLPANLGESDVGQKETKRRIQSAIEKSIEAEIPKKSKRSVRTQRKLSRWSGAGRAIAKKRPKSPVEQR